MHIDQPWLKDPSLQKLLTLLGGVNEARCVGGCVRNALLGEPISDIDIATIHKPEAVITILTHAGIKTIPTGIGHGTITALIAGQSFEITTLRKDVATDGRHATVAFSQSWAEDAVRRDFTINTLLADQEGKIYDPLGQGCADIKTRTVRFVGQADQRIAEDVLRILRFFRFWARYGAGQPDPQALQACKAQAEEILNLSKERITQEILKILSGPRVGEALSAMEKAAILPVLIKAPAIKAMESLISAQDKAKAPDDMARLYLLGAQAAAQILRLSGKQQAALTKLEKIINAEALTTPPEVKRAIYYHGRDMALQAYLIKKCDQAAQDMITLIKNWPIPTFPLTGEDLMEEGFTQGPALGAELARRQDLWLQQQVE